MKYRIFPFKWLLLKQQNSLYAKACNSKATLGVAVAHAYGNTSSAQLATLESSHS